MNPPSMPMPPMNMVGVLGAAAAKVVIAAVWYSPLLFVKSTVKLSGISEAKMRQGMAKSIVIDAIGCFLTSFVLVHAIYYAGAQALPMALGCGFVNWLGFVAVSQMGMVLFEKRSFKLFAIHAGFWLVSLLVMSAILTTWGLNWEPVVAAAPAVMHAK